MHTLWSSKIQGISTLDLARELRFRDDRHELLLSLLGLRAGMTVVDIGCGPGALTRKLARWLGNTSLVIGIDRDTEFTAYAQRKAQMEDCPNVQFSTGDALALPLAQASVDACTSHTVIEHVSNTPFLMEQKRVCRPGGRISVMLSLGDKTIVSKPDNAPPITPREAALWEPPHMVDAQTNATYQVGTRWTGLAGLPSLFQTVGLEDVQVDAMAFPVVVDDARHSDEQKRAIVEAERQMTLDGLETSLRTCPDALAEEQVQELKQLIQRRYDDRLALLQQSLKLWDYRITIVLIVSGRV